MTFVFNPVLKTDQGGQLGLVGTEHIYKRRGIIGFDGDKGIIKWAAGQGFLDGIYNDWGGYLPLAARQEQPQTALPGCRGALGTL